MVSVEVHVSETHTIMCDGCGADITYTRNVEDYRLVLGVQSKEGEPGRRAFTCLGIQRPLDRTHHFCGLRCLDKWRGK